MNESKFTTPMAIVVAGALVGAAVYFSSASPLSLNGNSAGSGTTGAGNQPTARPTVIDPVDQEPVEVSIEGEPFLGAKDAPVTLVEFTDYQCPFCKRAFDNNFSQLKEEYLDTGKVRYVTRDFPLAFHQNAKPASLAANCVYDQAGDSGYYEYHDLLFNKQSDWESVSEPKEKFVEYANQVGVDEAEFSSCYDKEKFSDEVDEDLADGQTLGVGGTPSFFINGKLLVGAQPYSEIKRVIDAELGS